MIDARSATRGRQEFGQWRPVTQTNAATQIHGNRPSALIGESFPPKSEARSTDLSQILPSHSLNSKASDSTLESQPLPGLAPELTTPNEEPRKLIANIPAAVLETLRSTCAAKAEVSLLGRIQGKHPGLKALTAWARDTLHSSLSFLSLKTNNLFEVTFTHPEGRIHALTQADLVCETAAIFFSSWRPHFDSKAPQAEESLDHPVWVQIVDLCQVLREETFLKLIGEQIGQVISIDNSEAYRSKLFGPRIRLLVQDLHRLPQTVVIPRLDSEGTVEYNLEYSGLPHQCGRCRGHDHLVRNCPKKITPVRKKEVQVRNKVEEPKGDPHKEHAAVESQDDSNTIFSQEPTDKKASTTRSDLPVETPLQESVTTTDNPGEDKQTNECEPATPSATAAESPATRVQINEPVGQPPTKNNPLQPDDINFPKLPSPTPAARGTSPRTENKSPDKQFVWKSQHAKVTTSKTPLNRRKQEPRQTTRFHTSHSTRVSDRASG